MSSIKHFSRYLDGILLLDKPSGITSNAALQKVKKLFAARKAGHTGSLDPLASGMLPICFGEATKFSSFLLESDKRYQVTAKLGIKTTTGDTEGEIIAQNPVGEITVNGLLKILENFRGEIQQIPSMFSALKRNGRPLYELARQGIVVERTPRTICIHELKVLELTELTFSLEILCSKGTYIRTMIEDIGDALGCGAHVIALRRLQTASYQENEMIALAELEPMQKLEDFSFLDSQLLPIDSAIRDWPLVSISEAGAYYLLRGQAVIIPKAPKSGMVRLWLNSSRFLGVGEILEDGRVAPRKLVQVRT